MAASGIDGEAAIFYTAATASDRQSYGAACNIQDSLVNCTTDEKLG